MIKQKYIKYLILPSITMIFLIVLFTGNVFDARAIEFADPIRFTSVDSLLQNILKTIQGIVAALAVLMIVVAGILYMTSAGDQGRVETAKKAVTAAIIGLALSLAAPSFLFEVYRALGDTGNAPAGGKPLSEIIVSIIKTVSGFVGGIAVLMLVFGGIMYITSAGDSSKADTAKNIIQYAIIGLIVALMSLIIVTQVIGVF